MNSEPEEGDTIATESARSTDESDDLNDPDNNVSIIDDNDEAAFLEEGDENTNMDSARENYHGSSLNNTVRRKQASHKDPVRKARVQRSITKRPLIVRHIPLTKPTSISNAANANRAFKSNIPHTPAVGIGGYMEMLLEFAGVDVANLDISLIEDRILQSTRADDETDAEHFNKVANAIKTFENIKTDHWKILMELTEAARRDLNEKNQHERYNRAIDIKEKKGEADVDMSRTKTRLLLQEFNEKETKLNKLESLSLLYEEYLLRKKLEAATEYQQMSIDFGAEDSSDVSSERVQYIKEKCFYSYT